MHVNSITYVAGAVVCCLWLLNTILRRWVTVKREPGEPEFIHSTIPFIGHAVGLFTSREQYYRKLRARRRDLPIYGIDILGGRQYVVNDPSLAMAVQHQARNFSFNAYGVKMANLICGLSDSMMSMMDKDLDVPGNTTNFAYHFFRDTHASLGRGPRLEQLVQNSIPLLVEAINDLTDQGITSDIDQQQQFNKKVPLSAWLRHNIIMASTSAVYGASYNPFNSPKMRSAYNIFESSFLAFILRLPRVFIPNAYKAQQTMADGMIDYVKHNRHSQGSDYIQSRYDLGYKYGASGDDIARLDLGGLASLNGSVNPACFWVMANIVARPSLLESIRTELVRKITPRPGLCQVEDVRYHDTENLIIDASSLWQASPILVSVFKETLRYYTLGSTVRLVLEDTWIGGSGSAGDVSKDEYSESNKKGYLLKEGGLIIIPGASIHSDSYVWGETASDFNPLRFLEQPAESQDDLTKDNQEYETKTFKPSKGAFRAFGGGSSLCPGRHWATVQILTIVSLMILMHDMCFVTEDDEKAATGASTTQTPDSQSHNEARHSKDQIASLPQPAKSNMTMTLESPAHDVWMRVTRRPEWRGKKCRLAINSKWQIPDILRFGE